MSDLIKIIVDELKHNKIELVNVGEEIANYENENPNENLYLIFDKNFNSIEIAKNKYVLSCNDLIEYYKIPNDLSVWRIFDIIENIFLNNYLNEFSNDNADNFLNNAIIISCDINDNFTIESITVPFKISEYKCFSKVILYEHTQNLSSIIKNNFEIQENFMIMYKF